VEEAKKMKCYERLIYKQFVQVLGLCGPQFLSYLPKRFTHLCRALYGDALLVYRFGAPIWPPEINKNVWSSGAGASIPKKYDFLPFRDRKELTWQVF